MYTLEFPLRETQRRPVNLESRDGTCNSASQSMSGEMTFARLGKLASIEIVKAAPLGVIREGGLTMPECGFLR